MIPRPPRSEGPDWAWPSSAALSRTTAALFESRRIGRSAPASWWSCRLPRKLFPRRPPPASMHNILIVDDESGIRQSLKGVLEDAGYKAAAADSGEACMETLRKRAFDVVLLDVWLPGMDGLETLQKIRDLENAPEVIIISGHGPIETAVRATKLGAYDFLEKPLSIDKTLILIKNAIDSRRLRDENRELKKQRSPRGVIVGESIPIKALRQQIQIMAPTHGRVLILG